MLTALEKLTLKRSAHHLKPQVFLGKNGLHEGIYKSLKQSLKAHELVKVKIQDESKESFLATAKTLAEETQSTLVGTLGRIAIFFIPKDKGTL